MTIKASFNRKLRRNEYSLFVFILFLIPDSYCRAANFLIALIDEEAIKLGNPDDDG